MWFHKRKDGLNARKNPDQDSSRNLTCRLHLYVYEIESHF
jgi:hypothetical protein